MKIVLIIILAVSSAFAYKNSDELINEINNKQNLWKAGRNFHKDALTRRKSNIEISPQALEAFERLPLITHEIDNSIQIPETFDARTQWPKCTTIGEVTDQGACLGCWAIATSTAASDRICIHSDGKLQPVLSSRHLLTCEPNSAGCRGGYHWFAWQYWQEKGLVTGGPYGFKTGCQPYQFAPCEHHFHGPKPDCPFDPLPTPECVATCDNSTIKFKEDLIYGGPSYHVQHNETQIQLEIMKNGPVTSIVILYEDFALYKSGVYFATTKVSYAPHTIKMIGWGVENGTKYWLAVNTWNEDWGEKGLFKIRRGTNECGVERYIAAGLPKQDSFN